MFYKPPIKISKAMKTSHLTYIDRGWPIPNCFYLGFINFNSLPSNSIAKKNNLVCAK
jgi:hypothetical protein